MYASGNARENRSNSNIFSAREVIIVCFCSLYVAQSVLGKAKSSRGVKSVGCEVQKGCFGVVLTLALGQLSTVCEYSY